MIKESDKIRKMIYSAKLLAIFIAVIGLFLQIIIILLFIIEINRSNYKVLKLMFVEFFIALWWVSLLYAYKRITRMIVISVLFDMDIVQIETYRAKHIYNVNDCFLIKEGINGSLILQFSESNKTKKYIIMHFKRSCQ